MKPDRSSDGWLSPVLSASGTRKRTMGRRAPRAEGPIWQVPSSNLRRIIPKQNIVYADTDRHASQRSKDGPLCDLSPGSLQHPSTRINIVALCISALRPKRLGRVSVERPKQQVQGSETGGTMAKIGRQDATNIPIVHRRSTPDAILPECTVLATARTRTNGHLSQRRNKSRAFTNCVVSSYVKKAAAASADWPRCLRLRSLF